MNQTNANGMTPLFLSCQCGYWQIVVLLVNNGAEVNQAIPNGATPLAVALCNSYFEIAELLLRKNPCIKKTEKFLMLNGMLDLIDTLKQLCNHVYMHSGKSMTDI